MSKKVQIILLSTLGAIGAIFFVSVKQHLLYTKYIQMLLLKKQNTTRYILMERQKRHPLLK